MPKRIMEDFSISEISAVDRPAQKGARMTIMKRDFSTEERERLAETGAAMSDGSFPIVTTEDLKNAVEAYGRAKDKDAAKKHIIRRARALDAVDELPDDWEIAKMADAVDTIAKGWIDPADGAKPFSEFLECSLESARYWEVMEEAGPSINALDNSLRSIAGDAAMDGTAKQSAMRESVEAFMNKIRETMPKIEEEIADAITDLGKRSNAGDPAGDHVSKKEKSMTDELKKVADLEKQVSDLTKRAEEAEAIAKMSAEEREHMERMDDKAKKDFMALSPEDRKKKVTKAAEGDEVLKVDGAEIRKSVVGDGIFAVLKSQQADLAKQADDLKKAKEAGELAVLEKRAADDFGHLPGTAAAKAKVLKAVDGMDEEVKKSLETILKTAEKLSANAFVMKGTLDGSTADADSPEGKLDKRAKEIQKAESITFAKAYAKAMDENPEIYAQITTSVASQ